MNVLHSVLVATIRPFAAMLLRFGVGYREFAEASKIAFVQVASEQHQAGGKPSNISRVALMTGLSRKEVRAVKEAQSDDGPAATSLNHLPAEVLHRWYTSEPYCDDFGQPKPLQWDSGRGSFTDLVRSCGASLSPAAMRAELLRIGAVRQDGAGTLIALRRYFIADSAIDRLAEGIQFGIRPLALTVARNAASPDLTGLRFQRVVDSYSIPLERRAELEQEITSRLKQFSEELDDYLSEIGEVNNVESSAVGIGIFYFEDREK